MTIDIEAIRKLCEAATPGPWYASMSYVYPSGTQGQLVHKWICHGFCSEPDRAFVVVSRTALPAALDELEAARKVISILSELAPSLDEIAWVFSHDTEGSVTMSVHVHTTWVSKKLGEMQAALDEYESLVKESK